MLEAFPHSVSAESERLCSALAALQVAVEILYQKPGGPVVHLPTRGDHGGGAVARGFASRLAKRLTGRFSSEPRAGGADAEPATRARGDSGAWADVDYTMDLRFEDLGLNLLSNGLQVLSGVTGSLVSRRVTAIMGPSGAGKVRARARDRAHS